MAEGGGSPLSGSRLAAAGASTAGATPPGAINEQLKMYCVEEEVRGGRGGLLLAFWLF